MIDKADVVGTHVLEKGGIAGTLSGAVMAAVGKMTLNDWLSLAGFMLAVFSVAFQMWATWYFKTKHLRIAERLAEHKIAAADDGDA